MDNRQAKASVSSDLLDCERSTSSLERLLLLRDAGGKATKSADESTRRGPPSIGPTPASGVLDRIRSFLPTLDEANRRLFDDIQANGGEQYNCEVVKDTDGRYVEMDLALGVVDLRTQDAVAAAELALQGQGPQVEGTSDSDSEHEVVDSDFHTVLDNHLTESIGRSRQDDERRRKRLKRKKIDPVTSS